MKILTLIFLAVVVGLLTLNLLRLVADSGSADARLKKDRERAQAVMLGTISSSAVRNPAQESTHSELHIKHSKPFGDIPHSWFESSKAARKLYMQQDMAVSYGDAFNALGLNHEQIVKLKQLLIERNESIRDAWQLAKSQNLSEDEASALRSDAEGQVDKEIENLVGPKAADTVHSMLTSKQDFIDVENGYAWDFAFYGCPATADQKVKLALLFSRTTTNPLAQITGSNTTTSASSLQNAIVLKDASAFLSTDQVKVLDADFRYQNSAMSELETN